MRGEQALALTPEALRSQARRRRDERTGTRITFSPKVFIPLTMLCRDKCGYCTFAKPPAHLISPYLELDEVLAIARRGAALGCHEALFTLGEAPEARYPDAAAWLAARGYASTVDYLVAAAAAVLTETGLLPHANAGALSRAELTRLRAVSPSQGMMIETLAGRLGESGGPHAGAPDKTPERRLATLDAAGHAAVPFTTGILVGIGKTLAPRLTVYPEYVRDAERWLDPAVRFAVLCASDSEGLARDDTWAAGGDVAPPALLPTSSSQPSVSPPARAGTPVGEVLDGVLAGEEVGVDEIVTL